MEGLGISLAQVHKRVGKFVTSVLSRPKRADRWILWLWKSEENVLVLWFIHIWKTELLQQLKWISSSRLVYVKGVPFVFRRYTNRVSFLSENGTEKTKRRSLPFWTLLSNPPPPHTHTHTHILTLPGERIQKPAEIVLNIVKHSFQARSLKR